MPAACRSPARQPGDALTDTRILATVLLTTLLALPGLLCTALQLKATFAEAERSAGPIDVLICNAGLSVPGRWFSWGSCCLRRAAAVTLVAVPPTSTKPLSPPLCLHAPPSPVRCPNCCQLPRSDARLQACLWSRGARVLSARCASTTWELCTASRRRCRGCWSGGGGAW